MTTGVFGSRDPADTFTGWKDDKYLAPGMAQLQAEIARAQHIESGRALLGYVLVATSDRPGAPLIWKRRNQPQLAGLPDDICRAALVAADALDAAVLALQAAEQQAQAWVERYRPSDELRRQKHEEITIEARTSHREATEAADRVFAQLGAITAELSSLRAELARLPAEQRADDASYAMRRQQRQTREKDLRAKLAHYGLLD